MANKSYTMIYTCADKIFMESAVHICFAWGELFSAFSGGSFRC